MSVFTRFKDILNSNINSLLDSAEDPEKMIKMMIVEMRDTLVELKASCADKMANTAKVKRQLKQAQDMSIRWQKRAQMAIDEGRDDLAREALIEKRKIMSKIDSMEIELSTLTDGIDSAKENIKKLATKISDATIKFNEIQDRKRNCQDQKNASKVYNNSKEEEIYRQFDRMQDTVEHMASENDLNKDNKTTEQKFRDFEEKESVDKELNDLKQKRGK